MQELFSVRKSLTGGSTSICLHIITADLDLQDEENSVEMLKNIEQEIECPRCNEIIMLTSDFDKLGYTCQECDLLLVMK